MYMQKSTFTLFCFSLFFVLISTKSFANLNNLTIEINETEDAECFDEASGFAAFDVIGGTTPYSFSMNGETNSSGEFEDLAPGDYTVTVTDGTGCTGTLEINIGSPPEIIVSLDDTTPSDCVSSSDGSFKISATGGVGDYNYILNGMNSPNGQFNGLAAGTYFPIVEDQNGCEKTIEVVIEIGDGIVAIVAEQENVDCFGNSNGAVIIQGQSGVAPYQYRIGADINTDGVFDNLAVGAYSVLVTDMGGCTTTLPFNITEPDELSGLITQSTDLQCFEGADGSFSVVANGGTAPFTFSTNGVTNNDGAFTGMAAGTYIIDVTDANDCEAQVQVTLTQPDAIDASVSGTTSVACFGESNGALTVAATGGTGDLSYSLNGNSNSTGMFSGLNAGSYEVIVSDANACSVTVNATVEEPAELMATIEAIFNINCAGTGTGAIDIGVTGGTGPFTYTMNGMMNNDGIFDNLVAGNYSVGVVDANACTSDISFDIEESDELGVNIIVINGVTCNGDSDGAIGLSANGGSGSYTYQIGDESNNTGVFTDLEPGSYTAFVSDDLDCSTELMFTIDEPTSVEAMASETESIDCNGNANAVVSITASGGNDDYSYTFNGNTNDTGVFEGVGAGTYDYTVSDQNGCTTSNSITVEEPSEITVAVIEVAATSCFDGNDGSITVEANGGTSGYTYTLGAATNDTGVFDGLSAGTNTIMVTDQNGCTTSFDLDIEEPAELVLAIESLSNAGCGMSLGSVELGSTGGNGGYMYTLGDSTNATGIFIDLMPGSYSASVEDEKGCMDEVFFQIAEGIEVTGEIIEIEDAECNGESSGFIAVNAAGGTGDFSFELNGEINDTGEFEDLLAGDYTLIISDGGGCTAEVDFSIDEPEAITIDQTTFVELNCPGDDNGGFTITASGGTGELTYTVNGETNTTGVFENLSADTYIYEIEDENGCVLMGEITIIDPPGIEVDVVEVSADDGSMNGFFDIDVTGGTPPYTYSLNGGDFEFVPPYNNLPVGIYNAAVMDANGCVFEFTVEIELVESIIDIENGVNYLDVFPNPTKDELNIVIDLDGMQDIFVTVNAINGKRMEYFETTANAGKTYHSISNVATLPAGIYIIGIKGKDFHHHFRIIKE